MEKNFLAAVIALAAAGSACAKPGDSVDSGYMRGSSGVALGGGAELKLYPLYENVWLGSQSDGDYFTDYGPFVNKSAAMIKVTLAHAGGARHDGITATVDGAVVARDNRYIAFIVMPGQTFGFAVKDYANISAYATNSRLYPSDVGLPSATDFSSPKAKFYACYYDIPGYTAEVGDIFVTQYLYFPGSMSDSSSRSIDLYWNGYLLGPKPTFDVQCEKYVQ
ncbi:hypothetical protein [Piscinibacter gummiphilus]|uniref:hypothetical protein n=1 Tax=Piscinibacter gummiphilus TaxID=946333 RepID=UPI0012F4890B|nr:hypothetical protein [Piscinibacter gummiphilus]GLS94771.1 hypothetical protein GCM10007918_20630 [Piscinibacter gummiphilus]